MTIAKLIKETGGIAAFSRALGIPRRTVENWDSCAGNSRQPPEYNVKIYAELLRYRADLGKKNK